MQHLAALCLALTLSACGASGSSAQDIGSMHDAVLTEMVTAGSDSLLRHVVIFGFKESATEADIEEIEDAFSALPSEIPEIQSYEWGLNNSPEKLNPELTHCYLLTFASEADRAAYLPHPAHVAFTEVLGPHLEKVTVVDYWTRGATE